MKMILKKKKQIYSYRLGKQRWFRDKVYTENKNKIKSVEEKNTFCACQLMFMFAFGYMRRAIFDENIYIYIYIYI